MARHSRLSMWQLEQAAVILANGGSKIAVARAFDMPKRAVARELRRSVNRRDAQRDDGRIVILPEAGRVLEQYLRQNERQRGSNGPAVPMACDTAIRKRPLVLVVDDDREILRSLDIRLKSTGFDIATAQDGYEGLDSAVEVIPDAIILDIRMPGMDGLTMLSKLRDNRKTVSIPTVVLSGKRELEARDEALSLGVHYFLQKPCETGALLYALNSVIEGGARH